MGLLDDAIREHLDLQRRRGADPTDIERAEREALGPVRRNREVATSEEDVEIMDPGSGSAYDEPDEGVATDLAEADEEELEFEDLDLADAREDSDPAGAEEDEFEGEDAQATRVMRAAEPPAPPAPHPAGDEDEDVLEETPEFLQDTPDHDRLWFEQRPPRDFDFDG